MISVCFVPSIVRSALTVGGNAKKIPISNRLRLRKLGKMKPFGFDVMNTETSEKSTGSKRSFESLRELIGLASAGAGIFAALLYLAGRSFAGGYFEAMNIPHYSINDCCASLFFPPVLRLLFFEKDAKGPLHNGKIPY